MKTVQVHSEDDLRDWFAGQALIGLLSSGDGTVDIDKEIPGMNKARWAYTLADAMMKVREEKKWS